ncbi:SH3 domain-containing protein [Streptomyces jeddahensis]|uniref:SH3 domain-containing protein n=1 Tax=Streptomyces jeddahensis TaxID=1716141 RepID=A0A177HLT6_9ACTN|nr:hypothetical protein [Streptomyces jeddahensis]OAH11875.1 hypothetical protein STSP_47550 [Streptomyces jeddahensis]
MTTTDFRPTHVVPQDGLPAWATPEATGPTAALDALLPVQLVDRRGDWGRIVCSNGWSGWVDGRLLVAVPQEPPAASSPLARTADPRPLLARAEDQLGRYRRATEDLMAGRIDGETFRSRTRGLRVGMVVDGEGTWLYDAEHERWVYSDGTHLTTYATTGEPRIQAAESGGPAGAEETRSGIDWAGGAYPEGPTGAARAVGGEPGGTAQGGDSRREPTRVIPPVTDDPAPSGEGPPGGR